MRVDLYQRAELAGQTSYLAVPTGELIPEEVVSIDWRDVARAVELSEHQALQDYAIDQPQLQIEEKGYAITSARSISPGS